VPIDRPARLDGRSADLIGRARESSVLDEVVASARDGNSRVLVITGDAGVGKTALLDHLAATAADLHVLRLAGAAAEENLPFAAVQRIVARLATDTDSADNATKLPAPQRIALRIAIGLESGPPPDRFLVGLAMHSLLTAAARDSPLLLIVDDLPWLDQESIDALAFVARRLLAEGIALVVSRRGENPISAFDGLPVLDIAGLAPVDAHTLLGRTVRRRLEPRIADQIVTATAGNPLAIIDLSQELSTHQLVGLTLLPEPLPVGSHLQAHYLQQTRELPEQLQLWLLLAAAEPTGDPGILAAASAVLGIAVQARDLAESNNLVRIADRVEFRHPLVRSAIYGGATGPQRRRVHNALAAVIRRDRDIDRRAWHLAAGSACPDEHIAQLLEQAAERARERGGYSTRSTFLVRAVELSPEGQARVDRTLVAADAALLAGRTATVSALLNGLDRADLDDIQLGHSLMIEAGVQGFSGAPGAMATIPAICLAAARAFDKQAPSLAGQALFAAFQRALGAEWMMTGTSLLELAQRGLAIELTERSPVADLVIVALAKLITRPYPEAYPYLRSAVDAIRSADLPAEDLLAVGWLSVALTTAIWDDEARQDILSRAVDIARGSGAIEILDSLLFIISVCETELGQLPSAAEYLERLHRVRDVLGMTPAQQEMFRNVVYLGWLGDDGSLRRSIAASAQAAVYLGLGGAETLARSALLILDIAECNYQAAHATARHIHDLEFMQISIHVLPDLVETAARSGHPDQARAALARLTEIAEAAGTSWALGVLERCRALVADGTDPEPHYLSAVEHLSKTRARADLARTYLLYGEWLRRVRRRGQAAIQLRTALRIFQEMGANSFAARAKRELAATGLATVTDGADSRAATKGLTPQETAIAELVAGGSTNSEIAAALIISQHTVDYHLRKIYRKLDISSRRQLPAALAGGKNASYPPTTRDT